MQEEDEMKGLPKHWITWIEGDQYNPDYAIHPSEVLREEMDARKISIVTLANKLHVGCTQLTGECEWNEEFCDKLDKWFKVSSGFWWRMYSAYQWSLYQQRQRKGK